MIGDVLFFKKKDSFISTIIADFTKSDFTHVGIIVGYDSFTQEMTIIESDRFIKTRIERIRFDDNQHVLYSVGIKSQEVEDRIVKYAHETIGTDYDYLQIFGLFLSLVLKGNKCAVFNSSNKYICSELIDMVYVKSGVKRKNLQNVGNVTPQELLELYEFKIVEKEVVEIVY